MAEIMPATDETIIDISDPNAPPAPLGEDEGVVVVRDVDDEGDKLPANAVLQPDGSVVLTMMFPVSLKYRLSTGGPVTEEKRTTLTMHRLNGAAMRAVMNAGQGNAVTMGIAKSCRIAPAVFNQIYDRMDGSDATAAAQVFSYFLSGGRPTPTGQPSSP